MKTQYTMNKEIAHTILEQLGGARFSLMTGAYNLGYDSESFNFKLKRNKSKATYVQVKYDYASDLYTVIFQNWNSKTYTLTKLDESVGLDVEQMRRHFTDYTGLYLTLGAA